MNSFFDSVLFPLEWVVAWLMVGFHNIFSFIGLPEESGYTWALSIVGLTVVIRIILIPLFVKQIHASRRMQIIQPEMQKIQKKYKGKTDPESRQAMTKETMALYKDSGTNPMSSCLPVLLQSPVFFALFRVLNNLAGIAAGTHDPIGPLGEAEATQANASKIFGAPLSATFQHTIEIVNNVAVKVPSTTNVKIVCVVMIILMSASTFTSMRQLMMKNMPAGALDNPAGKMQKNMMYLMPLMFIFSGVTFAIGVLLYWLTTNLWSMGQQFYTIRRMPAPGSPAEQALAARRKKSGKEHTKFSIPGFNHEPEAEEVQDTPGAETKPKSGQRQQPKRKNRGKPAGQGDGSTGGTPNGSTGATPKSSAGGTPNSSTGVTPNSSTGVTPNGSTAAGPTPPGAKPAGAKPSGAKPPLAKPPGARRPGAKPAASVDGES
jgi:YidC/Oxa1 family membrane protein insertase